MKTTMKMMLAIVLTMFLALTVSVFTTVSASIGALPAILLSLSAVALTSTLLYRYVI